MLARIVAALLIAGFVGLVIVAIRGARRPQPQTTEVDVGSVGSLWLHTVARSVAALPGHEATLVTPDQLRILWKRRPAWTIAAAVFFFPVGVLALLMVRWDRCSVELSGSGTRARARIDGVVSNDAVDAINRTLA